MSLILDTRDTGKTKKGNGVEFMRHQEQLIQRKQVDEMEPYMDTRNNINYTKKRDEIESKYQRLKNMKDKEIENQNEKMFNRLLSILEKEKQSLRKQRNSVGPQSLNIKNRKDRIKQINEDNNILSSKLNTCRSFVPNQREVGEYTQEQGKYRGIASNRRMSGQPRLDPLIYMKNQFTTVTDGQDYLGIGSPRITNGYKSFISNDTVKLTGKLKNGQPLNVFEATNNAVRYTSAKHRLPFNPDKMHQHSVKSGLVSGEEKINTRGQSPLLTTIDKMRSQSGLSTEEAEKKVQPSIANSSSAQFGGNTLSRRASMDVNSLIFNDSLKILDDNEKIQNSIKNKLQTYLNTQESAFLSDFLKTNRVTSTLGNKVSVKQLEQAPQRFGKSDSSNIREIFQHKKKSVALPAKLDILTSISQGRVKQISQQKPQYVTDAVESLINHQAQSVTKMMLADPKNKLQFGLEKAYVRDSRAGNNTMSQNQSLLSKGSTKKSTVRMTQPSQGRFKNSKSPIDKQDYMEMIQGGIIQPDIGQFNQSSSQNLDIPSNLLDTNLEEQNQENQENQE